MKAAVTDTDFTLYCGDALDVLRGLPDESVHCCVTSPPYLGLRDYGHEDQIGLEPSVCEYVAALVAVFAEVKRILRRDGTLWLNLGDGYSHGGNGARDPVRWPKQSRNDHRVEHSKAAGGTKPKDLLGTPWKVAFALQADGWYLRSDIIWAKPNPMPESVTDRPTKAHEYLFLLTRSARYFYDADAIAEGADWERWGDQTVKKPQPGTASWIKPKSKQELAGASRPPGRGDTYSGFNARYGAADPAERRTGNKRTVWEIATEPYPDAHFATFPQALVEPCILAGTSERGCCPECGAPWERETEVGYERMTGSTGVGRMRHADPRDGRKDEAPGVKMSKHVATTGWRPTCADSCVNGRRFRTQTPCTVLDPFMGSGTTALVARRHGRRSIGIELSAEYAALAAKRLSQLSLLAEPA